MAISLPVWITFLGALLTAVGAFWTTVEADAEQKRLRKEIHEKDNIIIEKSEKIEELAQNALKSVTGGDAFPEVRALYKVTGAQGENVGLLLLVVNDSQYPLYDVEIMVQDLDFWEKETSKYKTQELGKHISDIHKASQKRYTVGNLGIREIRELALYDLDRSTKKRSLRIKSKARNGEFNQDILLRTDEQGYWSFHASRIKNQNGILYENISPDFPEDQLWDDYKK